MSELDIIYELFKSLRYNFWCPKEHFLIIEKHRKIHMQQLHKKSRLEKEVLQIHKRLDKIFKEEQKLGYIKLEKPIRHGWFKELIITENVERYRIQKYIKEVYEMVEKKVWAPTKEEASRKWKFQTSKYLINKEIPTISKRQYNKLSDGAKRLCVPFQYYTDKKRLRTRFYIKIPKGAYKIKFTRAYVTHSRRIDPKLQSERILLFQQLNKKGYFNAKKRVFPWKSYWDWPNWRENTKEVRMRVRLLKHAPIQKIINEEISWERN